MGHWSFVIGEEIRAALAMRRLSSRPSASGSLQRPLYSAGAGGGKTKNERPITIDKLTNPGRSRGQVARQRDIQRLVGPQRDIVDVHHPAALLQLGQEG